jgi:hypothetical protein
MRLSAFSNGNSNNKEKQMRSEAIPDAMPAAHHDE